MWWMSIVGPILVVLIWLVTGRRDQRREAEVERWRRTMGPKSVVKKAPAGYRSGKQVSDAGPGAKIVSALPGPLQRVINAAGGGDAIGHYELVPKLAYLSVMAANATSGSDLQAVVGKLEADAPAFVVRPLQLLEGQPVADIGIKVNKVIVVRPLQLLEAERVANTGIEFKKDPEFMGLFQVDFAEPPPPPASTSSGARSTPAVALTDAERAKKIKSWLSRPVRDALRDLPDVWLYVQGRAMALVLYGPADAAKLDELVTVADVIFAEHGDDGGPSLFGDDEDDDAVDSAGEEEDDEVEEAPPPPPKKKSKPAAKPAAAKS